MSSSSQIRSSGRHDDGSSYLFVSERGGLLTGRCMRHLSLRAGEAAGLPFPIQPHMLRAPPTRNAVSSPCCWVTW
jgi:site-specific recombinase XerD